MAPGYLMRLQEDLERLQDWELKNPSKFNELQTDKAARALERAYYGVIAVYPRRTATIQGIPAPAAR